LNQEREGRTKLQGQLDGTCIILIKP